ncbi:MAG TPA: DUF1634 domain-containing protein [Candidatus Binataceae bacterium]|nr:DUF1634 domain-containing protein [Candidatus Binataceae bacterium]
MASHPSSHPAPAASAGLNMDLLVGWILLAGVLLSLTLLLCGALWHRFATGTLTDNFRLAGTNLLAFVIAEVHNLFHGALRPRILISSGIAVLMITPYIRVLASMLYFLFEERNLKYTVFTLFVLSVLTYSLMLH